MRIELPFQYSSYCIHNNTSTHTNCTSDIIDGLYNSSKMKVLMNVSGAMYLVVWMIQCAAVYLTMKFFCLKRPHCFKLKQVDADHAVSMNKAVLDW